MPSKICPVCNAVIPAGRFAVHKKAHDNATKSRKWTPEWDRLRKKILKRDRYRCTKCFRTTKDKNVDGKPLQLHVHHRDDNASNNDPSNLVTLCEDHHERGGTARNLP